MFVRKLCGHIFSTIYNNLYGIAAIALLGSLVGPSAILRAISTIVIDPIKSMAGRPGAHVCLKSLVVTNPSIANSDASPTIVTVLFRGFVVASPFHTLPYAIKRWDFLKRHFNLLYCVKRLSYSMPRNTIGG
jgi:hypothetical protein